MTMRTTAAALLVHGGITASAIELIGSKHVIGYYASWQWYDRDKLASPASLDYTKVTRVSLHLFTPLIVEINFSPPPLHMPVRPILK